MLDRNQIALKDLGGIVVVNGPGSFTGVRVGLSAVKGLAEPAPIPVSPFHGCWFIAQVRRSVVRLDAHRGEVFSAPKSPEKRAKRAACRNTRTRLHRSSAALRIAVSTNAAAALLANAWPGTCPGGPDAEAPTAVDTLRIGEARLVAGGQVDLALLDGHYLRRSDAEIFGEAAAAGRPRP